LGTMTLNAILLIFTFLLFFVNVALNITNRRLLKRTDANLAKTRAIREEIQDYTRDLNL
jgi:hypothetical protein